MFLQFKAIFNDAMSETWISAYIYNQSDSIDPTEDQNLAQLFLLQKFSPFEGDFHLLIRTFLHLEKEQKSF